MLNRLVDAALDCGRRVRRDRVAVRGASSVDGGHVGRDVDPSAALLAGVTLLDVDAIGAEAGAGPAAHAGLVVQRATADWEHL